MLIDWERDWFEKQILLPESEFIVNRSTENSIFFGKPIIFVVMYWACGVFCMSRAQLGCFYILIHCLYDYDDDDDDVDDDEVDLFKKHFHLIFSKTFTLFSLDY